MRVECTFDQCGRLSVDKKQADDGQQGKNRTVRANRLGNVMLPENEKIGLAG